MAHFSRRPQSFACKRNHISRPARRDTIKSDFFINKIQLEVIRCYRLYNYTRKGEKRSKKKCSGSPKWFFESSTLGFTLRQKQGAASSCAYGAGKSACCTSNPHDTIQHHGNSMSGPTIGNGVLWSDAIGLKSQIQANHHAPGRWFVGVFDRHPAEAQQSWISTSVTHRCETDRGRVWPGLPCQFLHQYLKSYITFRTVDSE